MPKDSLGAKLERPLENVKGGLKDIAQNLTEEDPQPTIGLAGIPSGAGSPVPPQRRPSATGNERSRTKEQLYADAKRLGIKGRSKMTKSELEKAVRRG